MYVWISKRVPSTWWITQWNIKTITSSDVSAVGVNCVFESFIYLSFFKKRGCCKFDFFFSQKLSTDKSYLVRKHLLHLPPSNTLILSGSTDTLFPRTINWTSATSNKLDLRIWSGGDPNTTIPSWVAQKQSAASEHHVLHSNTATHQNSEEHSWTRQPVLPSSTRASLLQRYLSLRVA